MTVTQGLEADEICVVPAPITILRGETVGLGVIGKKMGKSIGNITGISHVTWQSDNPQIARIEGPAVTGVKTGQANLTASVGSMTSRPATVSVVDAISDRLRADPNGLRLIVGQSVRIGSDMAISRGDMDVSDMCDVRSLRPECVRYVPETKSLVGLAPGPGQVDFTLGDKVVRVPVEVLPAGVVTADDGEVRIEPASTILAPGQAEALRVYVGNVDRTGSAVLASSDAKVVMIQGDLACAVGPGKAEITATFPGSPASGRAYVTVNNEEITGLNAPEFMYLSVGDSNRLVVIGAASCGLHELYPQKDLKLSVGGQAPGSISLPGGNWVKGEAVGQATVEIDWRGKLKAQTAVVVTNDPWTDLQISPAETTINPGEAVRYEVTANRGGLLRTVGPEQGVQLAVGDANVAQVLDQMNVGGKQEGRTTVVARLGNLTAEATLNVVASTSIPPGVDRDRIIIRPPGAIRSDDGTYTFRERVETAPGVRVEHVDPSAARLVVAPDPLGLWVGETGKLGSVRLDPGAGQTLFPVESKVTAPEGQSVVKVEGDAIHAVSKGSAQLTVTATDPQYKGLSASVAVQVDNPDALSIEPADMTLQVGETTPLVTVTGKGPDGTTYQAPALVESQDEKVLVATPEAPGHFQAKAMGRTQLKATYKGADVFATVTVKGNRFMEVKATPNAGEKDFDVSIEVLAAESEGPLEYRVYTGRYARGHLDAQRAEGQSRRVELRTSKLSLRPARHALSLDDRGPGHEDEDGPAVSADLPGDGENRARREQIRSWHFQMNVIGI